MQQQLYDMLLANQGLIIGWVSVLLVFLVVQILVWRIPTPTKLDEQVMSTASGWIWMTFFVITLFGILGVFVGQSINLMPRQTEDRRPAERDRHNFEDRIRNGERE